MCVCVACGGAGGARPFRHPAGPGVRVHPHNTLTRGRGLIQLGSGGLKCPGVSAFKSQHDQGCKPGRERPQRREWSAWRGGGETDRVVLLAHHPHAGGRAQLVATREGEVDAASALVVGGGALLVETVARAITHAQHLLRLGPGVGLGLGPGSGFKLGLGPGSRSRLHTRSTGTVNSLICSETKSSSCSKKQVKLVSYLLKKARVRGCLQLRVGARLKV